MQVLNRPWGAMHYRVDGPADGLAVVFANSLGTDLRLWDGLLATMPGLRAIRFDKRGHGLSDEGGAFSIDDLADDAAGWEIRTRENADPRFSRNIERFTQFLTLVGLTALLVGGVGEDYPRRCFAPALGSAESAGSHSASHASNLGVDVIRVIAPVMTSEVATHGIVVDSPVSRTTIGHSGMSPHTAAETVRRVARHGRCTCVGCSSGGGVAGTWSGEVMHSGSLS